MRIQKPVSYKHLVSGQVDIQADQYNLARYQDLVGFKWVATNLGLGCSWVKIWHHLEA